jgi:hypothetical protein
MVGISYGSGLCTGQAGSSTTEFVTTIGMHILSWSHLCVLCDGAQSLILQLDCIEYAKIQVHNFES